MSRMWPVLLCALALGACSTSKPPVSPGQDAAADQHADIAGVLTVASHFGPQYRVSTVAPTGIDPRILAPQKLPAGSVVEPASCAAFAAGLAFPPGVKGNMAAVTAEGAGNRLIAIAVQTSDPVPSPDPGPDCQKVAFRAPGVQGVVEAAPAPAIAGATVVGTHRVVHTVVAGKPAGGELYNFVAGFGDFLVIVTANPLVTPGAPVAPVDVKAASDLTTAAVAAVRAGYR